MVERISTFVQTGELVRNNLRVQRQYAEHQLQISSGLKSDNYQGLADDTDRLLNLESDLKRIQRQTDSTQLAIDRNEIVYDALGKILGEGQSFLADLKASTTNVFISSAELQRLAEVQMQAFATSLNLSFAGRYVFSGSATGTTPVDLTAPGFGGATPPSAPNTTYYQGNDFVQSVEIADNFTINYGVTANDPALEKVIRAIDLVVTSPADTVALTEAIALLEEGLDETAELQASVAQKSNIFERKVTENEEDINLITNIIASIKEVDIAEATVNMQALGMQLEASYSITTDLLNLNLVDFIR